MTRWSGDSHSILKNYKAHLNPNAHTPSSHVIQSEVKPRRGIPDGRKGINPYVILSGTKRSPENPAIGAFIIFLRFAGFLGKLGMTKKVGANQNPNEHTPSSHVVQSEAKPRRGIPRMERIIDLLMKIIMCE